MRTLSQLALVLVFISSAATHVSAGTCTCITQYQHGNCGYNGTTTAVVDRDVTTATAADCAAQATCHAKERWTSCAFAFTR